MTKYYEKFLIWLIVGLILYIVALISELSQLNNLANSVKSVPALDAILMLAGIGLFFGILSLLTNNGSRINKLFISISSELILGLFSFMALVLGFLIVANLFSTINEFNIKNVSTYCVIMVAIVIFDSKILRFSANTRLTS